MNLIGTPTLLEQIEWAQSLVDDERMPKPFRAMHRAVLASLRELAYARACERAIAAALPPPILTRDDATRKRLA